MSVQLPRRGDVIEVPGVGLCSVRRILPGGRVEAKVVWGEQVVVVELTAVWKVVK